MAAGRGCARPRTAVLSSHCQRSCIASLDGLQNGLLWLHTVGGGIEGTWRAARAGTSVPGNDRSSRVESRSGGVRYTVQCPALSPTPYFTIRLLTSHTSRTVVERVHLTQPYMKSAKTQERAPRPSHGPHAPTPGSAVTVLRVTRNSNTRYISSTPCTDRVHTYITYLSN